MASATATAAANAALVFGGRGFVGSAVCRELARRGQHAVLSLGRSGPAAGPPVDGVEQILGVDALRPETYDSLLQGAGAVVISIGEPPWILDKERAMRSNGLTNISILRAAAKHKVPRIILVNATMPSWGLIAGYREGKLAAEAEARSYADRVPGSGVLILKPGAVSGTRYAGSVPIPLWLLLEPMRLVMSVLRVPCQALEDLLPSIFSGVLRPAVRVEEIASAAADAVEDLGFKGVRDLGTEQLVGYLPASARAKSC